MTAKTTATVFVGVGLAFLAMAIVCRFIIVSKAMKAGVARSFWLEDVEFDGRGIVVGLLALGLVAGMASMVMGFVYTAKAKNQAKAALSAPEDATKTP